MVILDDSYRFTTRYFVDFIVCISVLCEHCSSNAIEFDFMNGYYIDHYVIGMLWEILKNFSLEDRHKFLKQIRYHSFTKAFQSLIRWMRYVVYNIRAFGVKQAEVKIGLRVLTRPVADELPTVYRTLGTKLKWKSKLILENFLYESVKEAEKAIKEQLRELRCNAKKALLLQSKVTVPRQKQHAQGQRSQRE
ncbi:prohibitin-1, mitochondrial-like protein [Tanacetum coccineum]